MAPTNKENVAAASNEVAVKGADVESHLKTEEGSTIMAPNEENLLAVPDVDDVSVQALGMETEEADKNEDVVASQSHTQEEEDDDDESATVNDLHSQEEEDDDDESATVNDVHSQEESGEESESDEEGDFDEDDDEEIGNESDFEDDDETVVVPAQEADTDEDNHPEVNNSNGDELMEVSDGEYSDSGEEDGDYSSSGEEEEGDQEEGESASGSEDEEEDHQAYLDRITPTEEEVDNMLANLFPPGSPGNPKKRRGPVKNSVGAPKKAKLVKAAPAPKGGNKGAVGKGKPKANAKQTKQGNRR